MATRSFVSFFLLALAFLGASALNPGNCEASCNQNGLISQCKQLSACNQSYYGFLQTFNNDSAAAACYGQETLCVSANAPNNSQALALYQAITSCYFSCSFSSPSFTNGYALIYMGNPQGRNVAYNCGLLGCSYTNLYSAAIGTMALQLSESSGTLLVDATLNNIQDQFNGFVGSPGTATGAVPLVANFRGPAVWGSDSGNTETTPILFSVQFPTCGTGINLVSCNHLRGLVYNLSPVQINYLLTKQVFVDIETNDRYSGSWEVRGLVQFPPSTGFALLGAGQNVSFTGAPFGTAVFSLQNYNSLFYDVTLQSALDPNNANVVTISAPVPLSNLSAASAPENYQITLPLQFKCYSYAVGSSVSNAAPCHGRGVVSGLSPSLVKYLTSGQAYVTVSSSGAQKLQGFIAGLTDVVSCSAAYLSYQNTVIWPLDIAATTTATPPTKQVYFAKTVGTASIKTSNNQLFYAITLENYNDPIGVAFDFVNIFNGQNYFSLSSNWSTLTNAITGKVLVSSTTLQALGANQVKIVLRPVNTNFSGTGYSAPNVNSVVQGNIVSDFFGSSVLLANNEVRYTSPAPTNFPLTDIGTSNNRMNDIRQIPQVPGAISSALFVLADSNRLLYHITFTGLSSKISRAAIKGPVNSEQYAPSVGGNDAVYVIPTGSVSDTSGTLEGSWIFDGPIGNNGTTLSGLAAGLYYVEIETLNNNQGEIRGTILFSYPTATAMVGNAGITTGLCYLPTNDTCAVLLQQCYQDLSGQGCGSQLNAYSNFMNNGWCKPSGPFNCGADLAPSWNATSRALFTAAINCGYFYQCSTAHGLTDGEIAAAVILSIFGFIVIVALCICAKRSNPGQAESGKSAGGKSTSVELDAPTTHSDSTV